jgi:hypothetical protein
MLGIMPALDIHWRLCVAAHPESRCREAPVRGRPTVWAIHFTHRTHAGSRTGAEVCTDAMGHGERREPWVSGMASICSPGEG